MCLITGLWKSTTVAIAIAFGQGVERVDHGIHIIRELTGDWPVFPGHPLVLATAIMRVFPSFDEANSPSGHGCSPALSDSRIPGSGDHVVAALQTLALGAHGQSPDAMIAYASRYWQEGNAGGYAKNVAAGQSQAENIEAQFRSIASDWFVQVHDGCDRNRIWTRG